MNKYVPPVILFVLACAVIIYLSADFSKSSSSFDVATYLKTRSKIDSLEISLWNAQGDVDAQIAIRGELSTAWESLAAMRLASPVSDKDDESGSGMSGDVWLWIIGGTLAVILCMVVLALVFIHRKKVEETRMMEAIRRGGTQVMESIAEENGAAIRNHTAARRSIIDDAETFAKSVAAQPQQPASKVAFENEHGVPENKILSSSLNKPILRPTAKQRISSAVQSLSDVLFFRRNANRETKAQKNATAASSVNENNSLETSRFDREIMERTKILQMSRRGFPASAIAAKLRLSQERVEAIIKDAVESGN